MSRRVRLRIDRLVLNGYPPEQRAAIAAGLRRELAERLAAPGALPAAGVRVPRVDAGVVPPAAVPEATGERAARAIVGRLPK